MNAKGRQSLTFLLFEQTLINLRATFGQENNERSLLVPYERQTRMFRWREYYFMFPELRMNILHTCRTAVKPRGDERGTLGPGKWSSCSQAQSSGTRHTWGKRELCTVVQRSRMLSQFRPVCWNHILRGVVKRRGLLGPSLPKCEWGRSGWLPKQPSNVNEKATLIWFVPYKFQCRNS